MHLLSIGEALVADRRYCKSHDISESLLRFLRLMAGNLHQPHPTDVRLFFWHNHNQKCHPRPSCAQLAAPQAASIGIVCHLLLPLKSLIQLVRFSRVSNGSVSFRPAIFGTLFRRWIFTIKIFVNTTFVI